MIRNIVDDRLRGALRIHFVSPLGYLELQVLLEKCVIVLTESGGIQEEGLSLNKPVLIFLELTERPEVVRVGAARRVGRSAKNSLKRR